MVWLKRKKTSVTSQTQLDEHKQVVHKAAEDAKQASKKVKRIFENNGFTIQIAAAMGAKTGRANNHGR